MELTISFYRRNYIEGLFLSSGVVSSPDYTMERMVRERINPRLQRQHMPKRFWKYLTEKQ